MNLGAGRPVGGSLKSGGCLSILRELCETEFVALLFVTVNIFQYLRKKYYMKFPIFLCAAAGLMLCMACSDKKSDDVRDEARESLNVEERSVPGPETNMSDFQTPPGAAAGVHHYTCPNNCEGSGGSTQVDCPVCGTQYVHNAAYHQQQQPETQTTTPGATTPGTTTPGTPSGTTPPADITPPAAQNAAGVYHYTCPNGCEGGAASAGSCANCGTALEHNAAYHQ